MSASDVVILFGGTSGERRVSVASGQHISAVLPEAATWFVSPEGRVHIVPREALQAFERPFEKDFEPGGPPSFPDLAHAVDGAPDHVFVLAFHGGDGEDGTVQRMLEARRIAFTGPGADASAKAMDKEVAKQVASGAGVRIAQSVHVPKRPDLVREVLSDMLAMHGRVVVKPVDGGSSIGVSFLGRPDEIERTAREIEASGETFLAEQFISGTEVTVGVVDGPGGPRALPPTEVRLEAGRAFDYEGKYLGKGTREITPAEVAPELSRAAQEVALAAHRALGCEGYSRTDIILSSGGPVFLELNTLPGLTRMSFIPQQLAAEGTSMRSFLDGQIELARRRRDRQPPG